MLQRVYGTAFGSQKELDEFLTRMEEAKRRDHRVLGRELDLFSVDELVGPGFVLWHPKGAIVRQMVEDLIRSETMRRGYKPVYTPHVAREALLEKSGHLEHYKENLFGGMELEGQRYLVKPMNCPFHVAIYRSGLRSYRELPLRLSELGTVYRYERSGVLHGLLRVRGFTQDDAHLFVRDDQIEAEMQGCVRFALSILRLFGFTDFRFFLATRPDSFMGDPALWEQAEASIRRVLEGTGSALRGGRGRRGVLRAQDRPQDQGRHRPRVAVRHVPARLPVAPAFRPGVRGRGRAPPQTGHDPPGAAGFGGTFHRRRHRTPCGGFPAVAGAGSGPGALRQREGRGLCQRGDGRPGESRVAGRSGRGTRTSWGRRFARPRWRRFPTWWWWEKKTWPPGWCRPAPGRASSCRPRRSTSSSPGWRRRAKVPVLD